MHHARRKPSATMEAIEARRLVWVDCLLLGGADLAVSMGLAAEQVFAQLPPPAIVEAMEQLIAACARHGKIAGNAAIDAADVTVLLDRGIRFIPIGAATLFLTRAAGAELAACRGALAQFSPAG